jgi:hypothetical protein
LGESRDNGGYRGLNAGEWDNPHSGEVAGSDRERIGALRFCNHPNRGAIAFPRTGICGDFGKAGAIPPILIPAVSY